MITGRLQKPPLWYRLFRGLYMLRLGIRLELIGPLMVLFGTLLFLFALPRPGGRLMFAMSLIVIGVVIVKFRMKSWQRNFFMAQRTIQRFWYDQRMLGYTLPVSYKIKARPIEELAELTEFTGIAGYWLLRFEDGDALCLKVHTENAAVLITAMKADLGMFAPVGADVAARIG